MFNLVNRAKKKNNKGFSLVELIVVVLIIAIIAVALAPQVMKYVGKSTVNTDKNNAATLKSSVQTAVADFQADGNSVSDAAITIIFNGDSTSYTTSSGIGKYIYEVTGGDYPKSQYNQAGFEVKVDNKGIVTVSCGALSVNS